MQSRGKPKLYVCRQKNASSACNTESIDHIIGVYHISQPVAIVFVKTPGGGEGGHGVQRGKTLLVENMEDIWMTVGVM